MTMPCATSNARSEGYSPQLGHLPHLIPPRRLPAGLAGANRESSSRMKHMWQVFILKEDVSAPHPL